MPTKFGNGRKTCVICDAELTHFKVLKIKLTHTDGEEMSNIRYFVPLCPKHWKEGCLEAEIGWEANDVPLDEVIDDPS